MKKKKEASDQEPASNLVRDANSRKLSRSQSVFDWLRNAIHEGSYASGARVREEEVAHLLGVSRTPVREALSRLQSKGILEVTPAGLAVAHLSRSQVIELYSIREILEGTAARFAAQHASTSEIAALRQIMVVSKRSLGDPRHLMRVYREFHTAIYEMTHNRYLLRILQEIKDATTLLPSMTVSVKGRPKIVLAEHASISDAIGRRDPDAAEEAARHHIRGTQQYRLEMMIFQDD